MLAYHSGEDRIVKARLRHAATGGWTGPAHLPPPDQRPSHGPPAQGRRLDARRRRARAANPRAASARLRAAEKLDARHQPREAASPWPRTPRRHRRRAPPARHAARPGTACRRRRAAAPAGPSPGPARPPARPPAGGRSPASGPCAASRPLRRRAAHRRSCSPSLAALAGAHTLIAQGQIRLDELDAKVRAEQARYQQLRKDVAAGRVARAHRGRRRGPGHGDARRPRVPAARPTVTMGRATADGRRRRRSPPSARRRRVVGRR